MIINHGISLERVLSKLEPVAGDQNIKTVRLGTDDSIFKMCTINNLK